MTFRSALMDRVLRGQLGFNHTCTHGPRRHQLPQMLQSSLLLEHAMAAIINDDIKELAV